jgi:hypothetical protein
MPMYRFIIALIACLPGFLLVLTCDSLPNSIAPENARATLIMQSSTFQASDTAITDTVGKTVRVGVCLYLTQYLDSTVITVGRSIMALDTTIVCIKKDRRIDTVYYDITFNIAGNRTIFATAHIGREQRAYRAAIHILPCPTCNRPPVMVVNGNHTITAGDTCILAAGATDPDSGQKVTFQASGMPDGATFSLDTFTWVTTPDDTGKDTITFIARDNGKPVLSDTEIVIIAVVEPQVNRAPEFSIDTVHLSGQPGLPVRLAFTSRCNDPDGDSISFALLPGAPYGDTVDGALYSFTPDSAEISVFYPQIVAIDTKGASDTLTIALTIIPIDSIPPAISLLSPGADTIVNVDTCRVVVRCSDLNGIGRVAFSVGSELYSTTKVSDSIYAATIRLYESGRFSTLTVTAIDSSPAANSSSVFLRIKYDNDHTSPIIRRHTPANDSASINANAAMVRVIAIDTSGIASVVYSLGTETFPAIKGAGDTVWSANVTGLESGAYNTITVVATDSSLNANKYSLTISIKYDSTMADSVGPVFFHNSGPANNTVVIDSIVSITDSIYDPSDVDSVYRTLNGTRKGVMDLAAGSASLYTLSDTLTSFHSNRIVIHAKDKSARGNRDSSVIILDYNLPPVINDTALSTSRNGTKTWTLTAQSADGDSLAWFRLFSPWTMNHAVSGTLPSLSFTPATNWSGVDSFYVRVTDGYWSDTAKIRITVENTLVAPKITAQPSSKTRYAGESVTFSVTVNADVNPEPTYRWNKDGSEIANANASSYTIDPVAASDSGSYTVTITNSEGTVTSEAATLTVAED